MGKTTTMIDDTTAKDDDKRLSRRKGILQRAEKRKAAMIKQVKKDNPLTKRYEPI